MQSCNKLLQKNYKKYSNFYLYVLGMYLIYKKEFLLVLCILEIQWTACKKTNSTNIVKYVHVEAFEYICILVNCNVMYMQGKISKEIQIDLLHIYIFVHWVSESTNHKISKNVDFSTSSPTYC